MRCWLIAVCALAVCPAFGQDMGGLAPLPPAPSPIETAGESPSAVLQRLDRLEAENAELRSRLDNAEASGSLGGASLSGAGYGDATYGGSSYQGAGGPGSWYATDPEGDGRDGSPTWGQPVRQNGDHFPTLAWSGFLQLDTGWVSQDAANKAAVGEVDAQTGLRRVRLRAKGRVRSDISYVIDLDFAASGHPSFRDVKFTLRDRPIVQNVTVGYFQQPFGLDAMSSGRDLVLMERQLPFAFAPFRQTGIGSYGTMADEMVTWSHSLYSFPTNAFGVSEGSNGGFAYAGRATTLLFDDPEASSLMHVGGSYSFQDPGNDIARYSIQPGFFVTDPNSPSMGGVPVFVDTGDIPTQNVNLADAELVGLWGPLSVQAEAVSSLVNPEAGPQLSFGGASAKMGYVLTGENHVYHRRRGVLGTVTPAVDTSSFFDLLGGAWEATAAWAWIDLNDESVQGGEMQTWIVGINRYMNSFTKLQLNVVRVLLDDPAEGRSAATVVALRAQAEF